MLQELKRLSERRTGSNRVTRKHREISLLLLAIPHGACPAENGGSDCFSGHTGLPERPYLRSLTMAQIGHYDSLIRLLARHFFKKPAVADVRTMAIGRENRMTQVLHYGKSSAIALEIPPAALLADNTSGAEPSWRIRLPPWSRRCRIPSGTHRWRGRSCRVIAW